MKRLIIGPLLISLSFLNSGFISKKANIKELFCEGAIDLSLIVDIKTGQQYRRMEEVFDEKLSNTIIPFDKRTLLILLIELPRCIKLFALDLE